MSDIVIKAENLGKKYTIGHQTERGRYTALRDVMMQNARSIWKKTKDLATGKPIIQGDTMEDVWALKDVNFEIRRGEAVGIIGRNGAGKSTLLKVLSRITEPSTGRLTIKGRVASLLEVGTGFHPELSGRENIYLNGTILGMTRAEIRQKFDEIVAFAGVEKYLDTPVKKYSSGMYVRLAFAVAAHLEPEILVVDEVLAVGDAQFQKKCLGKMEDVSANEGRTVLFVSHNMPAVQKLCSKVFLLQNGRLIQAGSTNDTVNLYLSSGGDTSFLWERTSPPVPMSSIERVYLVDEEGNRVTHVKTGRSLRIAMEYLIKESPPDIQVSFGLLDEHGSVIMGTSPQDAGIDLPRRCGKYQATVVFPKDLLLAKRYGVRAVIWSTTDGVIDGVDALGFMVQETASLSNSTHGGRAGIIALKCDWYLMEG